MDAGKARINKSAEQAEIPYWLTNCLTKILLNCEFEIKMNDKLECFSWARSTELSCYLWNMECEGEVYIGWLLQQKRHFEIGK